MSNATDTYAPTTAIRSKTCTRKGCSANTDRMSHLGQEREEHAIHIADGQPYPVRSQQDHWWVKLNATGGEPWRLVVGVAAKEWPAKQFAHIFAEYTIPDADGLPEAIVKAVALRDKLNKR